MQCLHIASEAKSYQFNTSITPSSQMLGQRFNLTSTQTHTRASEARRQQEFPGVPQHSLQFLRVTRPRHARTVNANQCTTILKAPH